MNYSVARSSFALISMSCYCWYGLFIFDTTVSETVLLCSATIKDFIAIPKDYSAAFQDGSTYLKADNVTVKVFIEEFKDFIAESADSIAD